MQPFKGLRSIWLFISLAFGMALVGHAAFWMLQTPLGIFPALFISVLAFAFSIFLMWRKFTFRSYPLRNTLPHGDSQNVIAIIPPRETRSEAGQSPKQVVFIAHLDSHRAVWMFANDFLVKVYGAISPVSIAGLILAPLAYVVGAVTGLEVLTWVAIPLALLHFLAWFTGVTADLGLYSPGANDNASAVGVALTLAERLKENPFANIEIWLTFTGCEESGCDGILHVLEEYGEKLKNALFVDLEMVGIGNHLAYIQREGIMHKTKIPPIVEKMILRVGEEFGIKALDAAKFSAFTEMGALWEYGYQGVCVLLQPGNIPSVPEWHRLSDVPDRLQPEALELVHNFTWKLLSEIDTTSGEVTKS